MNAVNFKAKSQKNNLSPAEKAALLSLSRHSDIIIKPADKGGAVVVWSRPLYIAEANHQLADGRFYQHINQDPIKENQRTVKSTISVMINANDLPPTAKNLIVPTPKTSRFYLLPKIHKAGNPGRPIVSACNCPTENIASYLDRIMCPLFRDLDTYVKDTNHALNIINNFRFDDTMTGERFLYTMDIKSLYTVIPNNSGLEALAYFLDKRTVLNPPTSTLTHLAELVLTINAFTFNGEFYKQTGGVAMGSKMGPNYACLFVGYIEEQISSQYTGFIPNSTSGTSTTYLELLVVAAWSLMATSISCPTSILPFSLHTLFLFPTFPSWTLIYALPMITSALPSTTRSQTRIAIFTSNLRIHATARMVSPASLL